MSFVFYDLETTGLSPAFDQPLQFAAIKTDDRFNEIERINLRCRLVPHIIPAPHALLVTGVTPNQLADPALPDLFEFSQHIMDMTERWAPATWVGYNTMKFDEEFLRQTFYQNLQPNIYATQFNGNTRLDILTAVYAAWCRRPDILQWPTDEKGQATFKLDRLAPANGFAAHNAHDALGDVQATIHIARTISARDPVLWAELVANCDKRHVQQKLETFRPVELVLRFGGGVPRSYIGCFCGYSAGNANQAAFFDLNAAEPESLIGADDDALFKAVDGTPKIIRGLSTNKAPALFSVTYPDPEHLRRADVISSNPDFHERVGRAIASRFVEDPDAPPKPVEKQIYGGFYSNADKARLDEFQHADWKRRKEIANTLEDPRLGRLGRRLVAFHSPELLTDAERVQFEAFLHKRWHAPDEPETEWMTIDKAQSALHDLRQDLSVDPVILDAIEGFIADRAREGLGHDHGPYEQTID